MEAVLGNGPRESQASGHVLTRDADSGTWSTLATHPNRKKGNDMNIRPKCSCSGYSDLMFSCSGAADIAEIGDRAVRSLHKAGVAKMFCLAGIAGKVEVIEVNTRGADRILVVEDRKR